VARDDLLSFRGFFRFETRLDVQCGFSVWDMTLKTESQPSDAFADLTKAHATALAAAHANGDIAEALRVTTAHLRDLAREALRESIWLKYGFPSCAGWVSKDFLNLEDQRLIFVALGGLEAARVNRFSYVLPARRKVTP
jgi:hypothetical protein